MLVLDDNLSRYLSKVNSFPMLSVEEEEKLARLWSKEKRLSAAHKLMESHLRLVVKVALQFRGYGLPIYDLISEGNIGLMRAIKKFDISNGARLATYAVWWIKATIQDYILKSWSLVKIGTSALQKKLFFGLKRAQNKIACIHGEGNVESHGEQISRHLGVREEELYDMNVRLMKETSIDAPVAGFPEGERDLKDMMKDENDPFKILEHEDEMAYKKQLLLEGLEILSEREKEIIISRKLAEKPVRLRVLSEEYDISQERIRQIEVIALKKLKEYCSRKIS